MTAHTRTPWHRTRTKRFIGKNIGAPYVCTVNHVGVPADEFEANSNLLWAAPELLKSLQSLLARYTELINSGDCGFWDVEAEPEVMAARDAIARATGAPRPPMTADQAPPKGDE